MCCLDKLLDFQPTAMPDLGISLDVVFYPGFDICVGTNQVYVVFYLPDIKMTIVKKLREGVAYNKGRNELYVWLTDDDLLSMKRSRVQVQVRIIDVFTDEMVCSTIQIINMDPIFRKRCTYSTSFNHIMPDEVKRIIMKYWSEGDHCNQNDHDDAVDALRWATSNYNAAIGKVTDIEQTKDGLKIHVEPISGYKLTKGLTFNKVKEEIEKSMNKKTVKDIDRIVITKNDLNEVLLRAYSGDQIVEKTIAKCSPDDIFDFNIGAKLSVDRLYEGYDMTPKPKRKPYNGKIFVARYPGYGLRDNTLYSVTNGIINECLFGKDPFIYCDMSDVALSAAIYHNVYGGGIQRNPFEMAKCSAYFVEG